MSFPALTPTQHTKALWVVGVGIACVVVGLVMELAAPPTLQMLDEQAARKAKKAAKKAVEQKERRWDQDAIRKLFALKRRGDQLTKVYNEAKR